MKIAGEKEMFMKIVDSIIVGPEIIRQDDVEPQLKTTDKLFYFLLELLKGRDK